MPGTPIAFMLLWLLSPIRSPLVSRYILLVAASGAFSRKSMVVTFPSAFIKTMNPPPPIFPAEGRVTAKENAVAIAASTAFPPFFNMAIPVSEDKLLEEATMPFLA